MTVATWLVIDATLDTVVWAGALPGGDAASGELARMLCERGAAACAAHPRRGEGPVGWPPVDDELDIELDDEELAFVLHRLDEALGSARSLAEAEHLPPSVRAEQRRSVELLVDTRAWLAAE